MVWFLIPMFGPWFWILSILTFIWIIGLVETEHPAGALSVIVGWVVVFTLIGEVGNVLQWVLGNPLRIGLYSGYYIVAGFVWGVIHWWWKQNKDRREYDERRFKFMSDKGLLNGQYHKDVQIPDKFLGEWKQIASSLAYYNSGYRVYFAENKKQIITRMVYWPISLMSYFFKDFLVEIYMMFLHKTRAIFEWIEKKAWSGTEDDFREASTLQEKM